MAHSAHAANLPFWRLLALARDLMQAPDLKSVLELVGPTLQELLVPDEALLVVSLNEQEYATAFDRRGLLVPADQGGVLFQRAHRALADGVPLILPGLDESAESRTVGHTGHGAACLLAIPFPPVQPSGVLSALWHRKGKTEQLALQASILRYLSELTGAALGNVDTKLVLEERISIRSEEAAEARRGYARELRRRDAIEKEKDRIAVTDVLTGMLNRRGFFLHAEQAFKLARRQAVVGTVIFADIDDLKNVNDKLGHDAGDHLIQAGARILQNSFRGSDIVARLGGDEFAAFTLDSGQPTAILARIQDNIDQFHQRSAIPYRVSFSIGIVQCDPSSGLALTDYLALADKQMYENKKGPRS